MRLRLDDLSLTTESGATVLLVVGGPSRSVLDAALAGDAADQVVMVEVKDVLFAGSLTEFCTRPDGSSEERGAAYLRRLFASDR